MNKPVAVHVIFQMLVTSLLTISFNLSAIASELQTEELKILYYGATFAGNRGLEKQESEIGLPKGLSDIIKNKHYRVDVKIYPTKEELFRDIDTNKLDGFWGTGLEVLERLDLMHEPMVTRKLKGFSTKQPLLVLARKEGAAASILQLKGKKLELPVFSDIEILFLNTQLLKNKQPKIQQFFVNLPNAKNPNLAIMDVYFGRADVTIVSLYEYQIALKLNPQLANKIKVVEQSPAYVVTAGGTINNNQQALFLELMDEVMNNVSRPEFSGFLNLINADSLEYIGYKDFDSIASLLNEYKELEKKCKTKHCTKKSTLN